MAGLSSKCNGETGKSVAGVLINVGHPVLEHMSITQFKANIHVHVTHIDTHKFNNSLYISLISIST